MLWDYMGLTYRLYGWHYYYLLAVTKQVNAQLVETLSSTATVIMLYITRGPHVVNNIISLAMLLLIMTLLTTI